MLLVFPPESFTEADHFTLFILQLVKSAFTIQYFSWLYVIHMDIVFRPESFTEAAHWTYTVHTYFSLSYLHPTYLVFGVIASLDNGLDLP